MSAKEGGKDTALAEEIAREHPLPAAPLTSYEQTMSPASASNSDRETGKIKYM